MTATHRRLDLRIAVPDVVALPGLLEIALSVHLPAAAAAMQRRCVVFAMPGAGYSRHYFDIQFPGFTDYSQADRHVADGLIFVAIDHLGVGDSTIPDLSKLTLAMMAAANDAVVREVLQRLVAGTLDPALPALTPVASVGIGQSMGGCLLAIMQSRHQTFDGIGVLGASMVETQLPLRADAAPMDLSPSASQAEVAAMLMSQIDWKSAFHWEDEPQPLIDADLSGGLPLRRTAPMWGSLSTPACAAELVAPGALAKDAAAVTVPVLLAMGERDVCCAPLLELGAFHKATDLAVYVVPRMAHMHNFASTRARLWTRIDRFVTQIADDR